MTNSSGPKARQAELDIVVFGATGFTGGLVAEVLVRKASGLRIGLAGRSREKLVGVRQRLAAIDPSASELPLLVGDSLDAAAMSAIAARTKVVCTTAGPYAKYGSALLAACVEHGADYCDLTGETDWTRAMIREHHGEAERTGARIVPSCGFDSIPSDLGVLMLHEHLRKQGKQLAAARTRVRKMKGGPSGGTLASAFGVAERIGDPDVRRALGDPYALNPEGAHRGPDRGDSKGPVRDAGTGRWTAPFVMAAVNTRVVRRSNALLDFAYGEDFRYDESMDTGRGAKGLVRAAVVSAGLGGFLAAVFFGPTRALLTRVLPSPGEGPTKEERDSGLFRIVIHGESTTGEKLTGFVEADSDPGYGATSIMLAESACCLAQDDLPLRGGLLTPASAMGDVLIERLRAAGLRFRVEEAT